MILDWKYLLLKWERWRPMLTALMMTVSTEKKMARPMSMSRLFWMQLSSQ